MKTSDMIFVFGSNLAGIHGAGAAFEARQRGYPLNLGVGYSAKCYAIPTKDCNIRTLPLDAIKPYVIQFRVFAAALRNVQFQVTRIGCGLAGHKNEDIAPMFGGASANCWFDEDWRPWLDGFGKVNYWGTFAR
jgi:hypothetical protein